MTLLKLLGTIKYGTVKCGTMKDGTVKYRLPKSSRLHLKRDIETVFQSGRVAGSKPLRCFFEELDGGDQSQILISVPKKMFKRAVDRNLLKRRVREAYRLNRAVFGQRSFRTAFVYNKPFEASFADIEVAVKRIFEQILSYK